MKNNRDDSKNVTLIPVVINKRSFQVTDDISDGVYGDKIANNNNNNNNNNNT